MILIYTAISSNRLHYILNLIFRDILHIDFELIYDLKEFEKRSEAKINYSDLKMDDALSINPSALLFESGIFLQSIDMKEWQRLPIFFTETSTIDFPFDPFAMTFYLVSRYEEYLEPIPTDFHERFPAEESLAYAHGFLNQPLVNQIAIKIKEKIEQKFPSIHFPLTDFEYTPTFDIDSAFAYLGKGIIRNTGGLIKSILELRFGKVIERFRVLTGLIDDPYEIFDFLLENCSNNNLNPIIFVNLGKYGKYDKNISLNNPRLIKLLKKLGEKFTVAIHPSYKSNSDIAILENEIGKLKKITKKEVTQSRQHYLKSTFPETYRNLIELGIKEDYSLGYASHVGFRASICTPFKFYDLLKEEETDLMILPFAFMDGTFTEYLDLSATQSLEIIKELAENIKEVGGQLISIWHNSAIADDPRLKKLFVESSSLINADV